MRFSLCLILSAALTCISCTKSNDSVVITLGNDTPAPVAYSPEIIVSLEEVTTGYARFVSVLGSTLSAPTTLNLDKPDQSTVDEGKRLSAAVCGGCHSLPEPASMKKLSWITVFSLMRSGLWARSFLERPVSAPADITDTFTKGFNARAVGRRDIWETPSPKFHVTIADFSKVFYYYMVSAPAISLPQQFKPAYGTRAPFDLVYSNEMTPPNNHAYSLAHYDEIRGNILIGQADEPALLWVDLKGKVQRKVPLAGIPVSVIERGGSYYVTLIGPKMYTDAPRPGSIVRIPSDKEGLGPAEVIAEHLERPVMVTYVDLDSDGLEDSLVSEFGLFTGALSWHRRVSPSKVEILRIFDGAGIVASRIVDFDMDGKPDILTAVSQADEEIILFQNKGKGRFEKKIIAKADPGFGLNNLVAVDVDGDGDMDFITANGDDYGVTRELRNSHGIRIFVNNGTGAFTENFIYPMYGALTFLARDFDGDGDIDIAAISRFADINASPPETFVYLDNVGGLKFVPRLLPRAETARWLAIATGDLDKDGALDLILASFEPTGESNIEQWDKAFSRKRRPGFVFLRNVAKQTKKLNESCAGGGKEQANCSGG